MEEKTKFCPKCSETKPVAEFGMRTGKTHRKSWCKQCHAAHDKAWRRENPEIVKERYRSHYVKNSTRINEARALIRATPEGGRRRLAIDKKYRAGHPARHFPKKHRISLEDYANMLQAQKGGCAICGKENKNNRRLSIDHDHETLLIRGLLCNKCNLGLGFFDDNEETMLNAIDYLEKSRLPEVKIVS